MKTNLSSTIKIPHGLVVFTRHKLGLVGAVMLLAFMMVAIFPSLFVRFDAYTMDLSNTFLSINTGGICSARTITDATSSRGSHTAPGCRSS